MEIEEEQKESKPKCSHGPNGRCINCLETEVKDEKTYIDKNNQLKKMNC